MTYQHRKPRLWWFAFSFLLTTSMISGTSCSNVKNTGERAQQWEGEKPFKHEEKKPKKSPKQKATQPPSLLGTFAHSGPVTSVAISPDSKRIVSASWYLKEGEVKVWDLKTFQEVFRLKGHAHKVSSIAYSPDGKWIATGSQDKTVKVLDANKGNELHNFKGHTKPVLSVAFSPDCKRIAAGSGGVGPLRSLGMARGLGREVWGEVQVRNPITGKKELHIKGHRAIREFSGDALQNYLLYLSCDVRSLAFSLDGRYIVTGSEDATAMVWNANTGKELLTLKGHSDAVNSVAISSDSKRIATGSDDKTVKIWDAQTGEVLTTMKNQTSRIFSIAFSPDGTRIASGGMGFDWQTQTLFSEIKVWDAKTGRKVFTIKMASVYPPPIVSARFPSGSVAFSRDGKYLVWGGGSNTVSVWDLQNWKELPK